MSIRRLFRFRIVLDQGLQFATVYVRAATSIEAECCAELACAGIACLSELSSDQSGSIDFTA
jgi:hypothetical protein